MNRLSAVALGVVGAVVGAGIAVSTVLPRTAPSGDAGRAEPGGSQEVVVTGHVDGDTIKVRFVADGPAGSRGQEVSARLLEIDAPEVARPGEPGQCYAAEASAALAELMPVGSSALAEPDRELLDRYGRTLLYFRTLDDGRRTFVNRELVAKGFAEAVLFEPNDRYIDVLRDAQSSAEQNRRGLWGACAYFGEPVP